MRGCVQHRILTWFGYRREFSLSPRPFLLGNSVALPDMVSNKRVQCTMVSFALNFHVLPSANHDPNESISLPKATFLPNLSHGRPV